MPDIPYSGPDRERVTTSRGIKIEPSVVETTNTFRGLADGVVADANNALKTGAAIRDRANKSLGNPDGDPNQ